MAECKIYRFSLETSDGDASMKPLLGGKGANLAQMCKDGFPVPPGFTVPTNECQNYYSNGKKMSDALVSKLKEGVKFIEDKTGKGFGSNSNPLLVSVRSGAAISMPGMMDTILNLGLNDESVKGLEKITSNKRFAMDSYRRFIQMYSNVVCDIDHSLFDEIIEHKKHIKSVINDSDLSADDITDVVSEFKSIFKAKMGKNFPQDVYEQLLGAAEAVFRSWNSDRAIYYRSINGIPDAIGTAVNIQSMVFGNLNDLSATGVAFTRNPSNGQNYLYGEFLINAQGEDVVAGIRTPSPINAESVIEEESKNKTMQIVMPEVYNQFLALSKKLELIYKDMQDIEFTIENGKLYILQTRSGKRTAKAAVKIAVDMVNEGLISKEVALLRVDANSLNSLLHKSINPKAKKTLIDKGLPASPGAAFGVVALSQDKVKDYHSKGISVILVRNETSPEDIEGMNLSAGVLTARGGMTSHAAVVARGMGKTCVSGASGLNINYKAGNFTSKNGITVKEGDEITIDGTSGEIFLGSVETIDPELFVEFKTLLDWADEFNNTKVRTNAETTLDAKVAADFGAKGIGLCRTEHMFFEKNRIFNFRKMILSTSKEEREKALESILPYQQKDFTEIFEVMSGLPVNIRLLDPPLHEFLPQKTEEMQELAKELNISLAKVEERVSSLHEQNPMLGHRGCRLGITYPEIYAMQARAIFEAACDSVQAGFKPVTEVMIPLTIDETELEKLINLVKQTASAVIAKRGINIDYQVGTMIETPRAALIADGIAKVADYFSYGTNDLTQTTLALSRDDSGTFIPDYISTGIFENDPFQVLDTKGVGKLINLSAELARGVKQKIKLGICGEHGGEAKSIAFCVNLGFDYVSCSPYRVPVARLAVAQAQIKKQTAK